MTTPGKRAHGAVAVVTELEIDELHRRDHAEAKPARRGWLVPQLVDVILAHSTDPWVPLTLGGVEIVTLRTGAIVVAMGPTGAGKTSLVCGFLVEHARERGPVVVLSRELPADELGARMIGMQCDASWVDVLMGRVARQHMEQALALPRMMVLDRREATLGMLAEALTVVRDANPGQPILVAIDYIQILESAEREVRAKVADVIAQIDEIARSHGAVVIAISQMSRAASRAARNGEAVGADSTDAGAESAAIERAATVTLSIGASGPEREDGTRVVDLSIGKGRMTGGDRVYPASYCGRSGRWRLTGDARPASEVKAERSQKRSDQAVSTAEHAIADMVAQSTEPMNRGEIRSQLGVRAQVVADAVKRLLESDPPRLVEVRKRTTGGKGWPVWTREKAEAAGHEIVLRGF